MFGDLVKDENGFRKPAQQRLHEMIAEIKLADETGLDVFAIGEDYVLAAIIENSLDLTYSKNTLL